MAFAVYGIFILFLLVSVIDNDASENVAKVRVEQGVLNGRRVVSKAGGSYYSFQGVPYAKAPIGPLRFKVAKTAESWDGDRDALHEGSTCTQFNLIKKKYEGEEDCLFLNVYTPQLPESSVKSLPVMVWIHGGGFAMGSGNADMFGSDYLVSEDVVLVTMNYRLSLFGFLHLDEAAPGNLGLKDQVMALRWVQKNIAAFGGDPGKVTIFGQSVGGASVHLHTLSPMSEGLFQRAIAQSGTAMNYWSVQQKPAEKARLLARLVGCTDEDAFAIVDCLRGVDSKKLIETVTNRTHSQKESDGEHGLLFSSTLEDTVSNMDVFLPKCPKQLLNEGRQHHIPLMIGATDQEGLHVLIATLAADPELNKLEETWIKKIKPALRLPDDSKLTAAVQMLRKFYTDDKPFSNDTLREYGNMFTDLFFDEGIMYTIKSLTTSSLAPVYVYEFVIDDKLNYLKGIYNITWPGATHSDELGYLFLTEKLPEAAEDEPAGLARRRMTRLWTNFAKMGDPTPKDDSLLGVRWKLYTKDEHNYLEIGQQLTPRKGYHEERMTFWENYRNFTASPSHSQR